MQWARERHCPWDWATPACAAMHWRMEGSNLFLHPRQHIQGPAHSSDLLHGRGGESQPRGDQRETHIADDTLQVMYNMRRSPSLF